MPTRQKARAHRKTRRNRADCERENPRFASLHTLRHSRRARRGTRVVRRSAGRGTFESSHRRIGKSRSRPCPLIRTPRKAATLLIEFTSSREMCDILSQKDAAFPFIIPGRCERGERGEPVGRGSSS